MMAVDPWAVGTALIHLTAAGFSPVAVPFVLFLNFFVAEEWWRSAVEGWTVSGVMSIWLPAVAIVTYWANGFILLLVDTLIRPQVLQQFKIQPDKQFDLAKLGKVCRNLISGQFLVIVPYGFVCGLISVPERGFAIDIDSLLPSPRRMCLETVFFVIFNEFVFFYSHWALHSKIFGVNLYTRVHKIHHEFTAPIGLVASYCHPVEMFISNAFPLTFGALIVNAHLFTIIVWVFVAVLGTQFHHCGFRWPWLPPLEHHPNFHDFHHQKFVCNYGAMGWLDALHGTDKLWKEHVKQRRPMPASRWSKALGTGAALALAGSLSLQFVA